MTDDDPPDPRLYLITTPIVDALVFAPQLAAALEAADVACVLVEIEESAFGAAKKILRELAAVVQDHGAALLTRDPAIAARAGADGAHISGVEEEFAAALGAALTSLKPERIVGAAVASKHDAMFAAERGADYVMFGEPSAHRGDPPLDLILERIAWWSEIFTPPCVAYAASLDDVGVLAAAGADFVALGSALWSDRRGPGRAAADAAQILTTSRTRAP